MKRLGSAETADEQAAEAAIAAANCFPNDASYALLVPDVISPVHRGVESAVWTVEAPGQAPTVLKVMRPDMLELFDTEAAVAGARQAAAAGAGPAVHWADPATGAIALAQLGADWRTVMLFDLQQPDTMAAALDAVRRLHAGPAVEARFDVFAQIQALDAPVRAAVGDLPADLWWLQGEMDEIADAIAAAGADAAPCRNDGASSNLMIGPEGTVSLLDFDRAGTNDPLYDLAVLIAEAHPFASEAARTVEIWCGRFEPKVLDRCLLYGAADDLLWGLWGLLAAAQSSRRHVEFRKYAEWRLMRCRTVLGDPRYEERLRSL